MTLFALLFAIIPQTSVAAADPTVPDGAAVLLTAAGRGVQIYSCSSAGGAAQWTLLAPQAVLVDPTTGKTLGSHSAGPTWTWNDGSAVHGKVVARQASPEATSIPWLLLAAEQPAERGRGAMAGVTWIRRSATTGGVAPASGCDADHLGLTARIPYSATYTFYGSASTR